MKWLRLGSRSKGRMFEAHHDLCSFPSWINDFRFLETFILTICGAECNFNISHCGIEIGKARKRSILQEQNLISLKLGPSKNSQK